MTHLLMKYHRRSSIYLMKVASALVKPKCMTNHSIESFLGLESYFPYIDGLDQNLMISQLEVKIRKELSTFQAVNEFIYPCKRIHVLYSNLVESPIVNAHVQSPIFLWN